MTDINRPTRAWWMALTAVAMLAGCASSRTPAPVEDRTVAKTASRTAPDASKSAAPAAAAPVEVKAGFYMVKPGDTLMRIALDNGQSWRDVARWNGIENPNVIEVGQVLRVSPPPETSPVATARPVAAPKLDAKPLEARPAASAAAPATSAPAPAPVTAPKEGDEDVQWAWPAGGPLVSSFDETRSKGLGIGGKAGDPVLAAADGRVVYAGSGLRGYGNLIIVKHNATYLTAYAHNQTLLVKEDQVVRKGQKIAEMGSTDTDKVQLHFEIRRQGKPVDPARMLPAR